jgi:hypothetical protein
MVLINAIPAAAATPVRNWVGTVQKFGSAEKIAQAVMVMTTTVNTGLPAYSASGAQRAGNGRDHDVAGPHAAPGGVPGGEEQRDRGRQVRDGRDQALLNEVELGPELRLEARDDGRQEERQRVWVERAVDDPKQAQLTCREHEAIVTALRARDARAAAEAMSTHTWTAPALDSSPLRAVRTAEPAGARLVQEGVTCDGAQR